MGESEKKPAPTMNVAAKLFQKMAKIQAKLDRVDKAGRMSMGRGDIKYVSHEDVWDAFKPLFVEFGVMVVPSMRTYEETPKGVRCIYDIHVLDTETGYSEIFTALGESIAGDKAPNIAQTFALKYWLLRAFTIYSGDEKGSDYESRGDYRSQRAPQTRRQAPQTVKPAPQTSGGDYNVNLNQVKRAALNKVENGISETEIKDFLADEAASMPPAMKKVLWDDIKAAIDARKDMPPPPTNFDEPPPISEEDEQRFMDQMGSGD